MFLRAVLTLTALFPLYASASAPGKLFDRIIVVVLENTNYDDALRQPFQSSLARNGALLTRYSGITHPSQPNYIALISGSTQGVSGNQNINLSVKHLGDLLEEKGHDWATYAEGFPGNCFTGSSYGNYVRKHNPFISFVNVHTTPSRCAKIRAASNFDADLSSGKLPEFSLYVPDQKNNGHDTGAAYADRWLKSRFEKLVSDPKFMEKTLFVVTYDEDEAVFGGSDNRVYASFFGPMVKAGAETNSLLNHYSLLKLVEDNWSLDRLTREDSNAGSISDIWN